MSKRSRQHRAAQARRNGAQSQGPVTAQGKATSARNAITHGLASRRPVLLQDEDPAAFEELRRGYYTQFLPHNPVEFDLVDEMIQSRWLLRRCHALETALLELERACTIEDSRERFSGLDPAAALALAFRSLADNSRSFQLLQRYRSGHARDFRRALDTLCKLRALPDPLPAELQTNPAPTPYPPENTAPNEIDQTNRGAPAAPPPEAPAPPAAAPCAENRPAFRLIEFPTDPLNLENPSIQREKDSEKDLQ